MFNKTRIYSVYVKKGNPSPLYTAKFIKDGFNIWAFIFNIFWFAFKRVWWVVIVLIIIYMSEMFLVEKKLLSEMQANIIGFGINLWLGLQANALTGWQLERKGYYLIDVVTARDALEAEKRFYDKYAFANRLDIPQNNYQQNMSISAKPV